jgi:hypothetical protein
MFLIQESKLLPSFRVSASQSTDFTTTLWRSSWSMSSNTHLTIVVDTNASTSHWSQNWEQRALISKLFLLTIISVNCSTWWRKSPLCTLLQPILQNGLLDFDGLSLIPDSIKVVIASCLILWYLILWILWWNLNFSLLVDILISLPHLWFILKNSICAVAHGSLLVSFVLGKLSLWRTFVPYLVETVSLVSEVFDFLFVSLVCLLEASICLCLILIKHWFSNVVLNCLIELHLITWFHFLV